MDKKIFVKNIREIEIVWGQSTPEKLDVYFNLFKNFKNEEFIYACKKILITRSYPTSPFPADFFEAAKTFKPVREIVYDKNCHACGGSGIITSGDYPLRTSSAVGYNWYRGEQCGCGKN